MIITKKEGKLIVKNKNSAVKFISESVKINDFKLPGPGEYEVGGTSWIYLASKEFEKLDFPKLGKDPAPGVSEAIQHGVFAYFVPPVALYALLGGVMWINKNKKKSENEEM